MAAHIFKKMDGQEKRKMTNAERMKKYRQRNKEKVREANKNRMCAVRKIEKEKFRTCQVLQDDHRKKERERKQRYRQKTGKSKAANENQACPTTSKGIGSYNSPQSFGKAVKRVSTSLPESPRKKQAVLTKLAKQEGFKFQTPNEEGINEKAKTTEQTAVEDFFQRTDIVYTCPGIKEEMTVWKNGKKFKLRKFYLTMFLKEAYCLFIELNPEITIGFSTFCKMRPENVLLLHQTPADQCKCMTCENFFMKLSPLKIEYSRATFWNSYLCHDAVNSDCWNGLCKSCRNGQKITLPDDELAKEVTWKEWEKTESKRLICSVKTGSAGELLDHLKNKFNNVSTHINLKRIQAEEFSKDKVNPGVRVLQLDFAMSYSCEYQNEVQSALWSRSSVTLFTAASIHCGECNSFLICSNTKEKNTVSTFINHLYEHELKPNSPEMKEVEEVIWTDGPSSEFKNRFMAKFLSELSVKYQKTFTWKYSATSHGKGVVDGIGGRAKSIVRTAVMSKSQSAVIVQNSRDFADVVRGLMPSTTVILIEDKDIPKNEEVWQEAVPIPGIKRYHVVRSVPNHCLQFFYNALQEVTLEENVCEDVTSVLTVGNWILVTYDTNTFPGEIVDIINGEFEVNVMVKAGPNTWKWPQKEDKLWYTCDDVVKVINPPIVSGSRGQFMFRDDLEIV